MFITIEKKKFSTINPFWIPNIRNLEPQYIDEYREIFIIHKTVEDFRNYLASRNPFSGEARHFSAEEIFPKIKTTIELEF